MLYMYVVSNLAILADINATPDNTVMPDHGPSTDRCKLPHHCPTSKDYRFVNNCQVHAAPLARSLSMYSASFGNGAHFILAFPTYLVSMPNDSYDTGFASGRTTTSPLPHFKAGAHFP